MTNYTHPVRPVQSPPADIDLAWATGVFEGEGFVSMASIGKGFFLGLSMTDADIIMRVAEILGLRTYGPYQQHNRKIPIFKAAVYNWPDIERAAGWMWPWLGDRRREQVLRIWNHAPRYALGQYYRGGTEEPKKP